MSDEFVKVATKEINENLDNIIFILNHCKNDFNVQNNATKLEKYFHNLKGLAPMMGKSDIGTLSAIFDQLLKQLIDKKTIPEIFQSLTSTTLLMKQSMTENKELNSIIDDLSKKYGSFLS